METVTPTERTRVIRHPERAVYEFEQICSILDEGYVCHMGFVADGQPYVIPTVYGREGDQVYIHGSAAGRMLRALAKGIEICLTVTLVDGLVLARSAFRHSINYRSVVILGTARLVSDPAEKLAGLRCVTNHFLQGRWEEVRPPNPTEMASTSVLAMPIAEVSAKVRSGPPKDLEDDYGVSVWAGVLPVRERLAEPVPDDHLLPGVALPAASRLARFR